MVVGYWDEACRIGRRVFKPGDASVATSSFWLGTLTEFNRIMKQTVFEIERGILRLLPLCGDNRPLVRSKADGYM